MENILFQIRRVWLDFVSFACFMLLLGSGWYKELEPPIQLVALKALLVSAGFMHAHIMRKMAFPSVEWTTKKNSQEDGSQLRWLVIGLYLIVIYAYAKGG